MDRSNIGIVLLTALSVYLLYEKSDNNTSLTSEHHNVSENVKRDLTHLIDLYYKKYIYPHQAPNYEFIIPASRSETHNKEKIYVMINDPVTGEIFSYNSLLQAGAHECAHMLCRVQENDEHGPIFINILNKLETIASELQMFDPSLEMPARYKQLCM